MTDGHDVQALSDIDVYVYEAVASWRWSTVWRYRPRWCGRPG